MKRHLLLDISDHARAALLAELAGSAAADAPLRQSQARILLPEQAGARIPAVVRREEGALPPGCIPVGFSAPWVGPQGRPRLSALVRGEDVLRATSPYELLAASPLKPRTPCTRALAAASKQARELGLQLGVWGSAALELYTGLACTHQDSDLDLLLGVAPRETLHTYLTEIEALEQRFGLRIDVELDLANGYGVHLKELFAPGRTVLGKSLQDVKMLLRAEVFASLPQCHPGRFDACTTSAQSRETAE